MRPMVVVVGVALGAMLALPGAAFASHDPSGAPFGQDFVRVETSSQVCPSPTRPCLTQVTRLDARSGPSGENATGFFTLTFDGRPALEGSVTCLSVQGNRAVVGIDARGLNLVFFVEDNAAAAVPDRLGVMGALTAPTLCPPFTGDGSVLVPVVTGDVVVHDAPALPTSKDQCKNGGWQTFGIFKNQGDCVSFVASGGKNPPGG